MTHARHRASARALRWCSLPLVFALAGTCQLAAAPYGSTAQARPAASQTNRSYLFNDCHVHLTNYIQEGTDVRAFLGIMGDRIGRAALFGVPLQQLWSHRVSGDNAPTYYLGADTPLYYYSFTDAHIAMVYRSLSKELRVRFDPMITGFNPADMYAADHIERVLRTFPGVFSGIGEFTIHKEFVSSKVSGVTASLQDPALDRVLGFAAESGLLVLVHNDIDIPFAKADTEPAYLEPMRTLLARHPKATIVWAHLGLGRVIHPVARHRFIVEDILKDPKFSHVYFDLSWSEVAKYVTSSPEALQNTADVLNRYPDRFLFGTDEVAPKSHREYVRVFEQYAPLWKRLEPGASAKIRLGNYERLFDAARRKVRAWESANVKSIAPLETRRSASASRPLASATRLSKTGRQVGRR
jgi:hypothetical protein